MTVRTVTVHLRAIVTEYLANNKRAERSTRELRQEVRRLNDAAGLFTRSGLIGTLAAVPGVAAPAAAALSAMPAILVSSAVAAGALALATNGVGEAMKAVAEGDADALNEVMSQLTEEGREFVRAYERVKPILDEMADRHQDAFFRQLRGDLELTVKTYMPTMLNQAPKAAAALGRMGHEMVKFGTAPTTVAKVNRQIQLAVDITQDWTRFLRAGVGLMLDLADSGQQFSRDTVGGLARGTEAMRRWVQTAQASGQLNNIYANGTRVLQALGRVAAETGDLLFDMAANPALADATVTFLDMVGSLVDLANRMLAVFSMLPAPLQSTAAGVIAVAGAVLLLGGRLAAMRAGLAAATLKLDSMGPSGERAARGLNSTAAAAGKVAGAFVAFQVAAIALNALTSETVNVERLNKALLQLGNTGQRTGELNRVFGDREGALESAGRGFLSPISLLRKPTDEGPYEGLIRDMRISEGGFGKFARAGEEILPFLDPINRLLFGTSATSASANLRALDQELTSLVETGNAKAADNTFLDILRDSGKSLHEMQQLLPNYTQAMKDAGQQTDLTARAQADAAAKSKLLSTSLRETVRWGASLTDVFDELNGEALDWAEALDNLEAAFDDARETIADNGKTLNATTEAGRANRAALRDIAEATRAAQQARLADTGSLEQAMAVYERGRKAFIDNAMAAGLARTAAEKLADEWMAMPKLNAIAVTTPGLDAAIARVKELQTQLNRLTGKTTIRIGVENTGRGGFLERRWGGITEARFGTLRDAGIYSPTSPGRFMIAEPGTRGEAFVPKSGDYGRSMSILSTAAGWYGARVVPAGAGGGGGGGPSSIVVQLIDPMSGQVLRQKQIDFAQSRGVPAAAIRAAYP